MPRSTIALAFMAHNESEEDFVALHKCAAGRISSWTAVIAPSDHATIATVEKVFGDIPGSVHQHEFPRTRGFLDFAQARNRMLDLARQQNADYVLWLDPDDPLSGNIPNELADATYAIEHIGPGSAWVVTHLIRSDADVRWEGQIHEHLEGERNTKLLSEISIHRTTSGSSISGIVESEFLPLLMDLCKENPEDKHAWFYLAQTLRDLGRDIDAAAIYAHRAEMGGWAPIVFWCYFQIAEITGRVDDYLVAWNFRSTRIEPLHRLAALYNARGQHVIARTFATIGLDIPPTDDAMFVERGVEQYGLLYELAVAQNGLGETERALRIWGLILTLEDVPPKVRASVERNLKEVTAPVIQMNRAQRRAKPHKLAKSVSA